MQHIHLEVQNNHMQKLMNILNDLQDVMIDKIQIEDNAQSLISLQESSMTATWDNKEDKAWDELYDW